MALKDEKFRVATRFRVNQLADPVHMRIVSSVLFAYAKILAQHCPYKGVTSGLLVSNYFSENFVPWFAENFPLLANDSLTTSNLRNKAQAWFRTQNKRWFMKNHVL